MATVAQALEAAQAEGWTEDQFAKALYDEFKIDLFATNPEFELPIDISAIPEKVIPTDVVTEYRDIPEADIAAQVKAATAMSASRLPKAELAARETKEWYKPWYVDPATEESAAEAKEAVEKPRGFVKVGEPGWGSPTAIQARTAWRLRDKLSSEAKKQFGFPLEQNWFETAGGLPPGSTMEMASAVGLDRVVDLELEDVVKIPTRVLGAAVGLATGLGEFLGDITLELGAQMGISDTSPGPASMLHKIKRTMEETIDELAAKDETFAEYVLDDMQMLIGAMADIFRRTIFGEAEPSEADRAEGMAWLQAQLMEATKITEDLLPGIVMHINAIAQDAMEGNIDTLYHKPVMSALVLMPIVKGMYRFSKATLPPELIDKYNTASTNVKNKIQETLTPEFIKQKRFIDDLFDKFTLEPSTEVAATRAKVERAAIQAEADVSSFVPMEPQQIPKRRTEVAEPIKEHFPDLLEEPPPEISAAGAPIFGPDTGPRLLRPEERTLEMFRYDIVRDKTEKVSLLDYENPKIIEQGGGVDWLGQVLGTELVKVIFDELNAPPKRLKGKAGRFLDEQPTGTPILLEIKERFETSGIPELEALAAQWTRPPGWQPRGSQVPFSDVRELPALPADSRTWNVPKTPEWKRIEAELNRLVEQIAAAEAYGKQGFDAIVVKELDGSIYELLDTSTKKFYSPPGRKGVYQQFKTLAEEAKDVKTELSQDIYGVPKEAWEILHPLAERIIRDIDVKNPQWDILGSIEKDAKYINIELHHGREKGGTKDPSLVGEKNGVTTTTFDWQRVKVLPFNQLEWFKNKLEEGDPLAIEFRDNWRRLEEQKGRPDIEPSYTEVDSFMREYFKREGYDAVQLKFKTHPSAGAAVGIPLSGMHEFLDLQTGLWWTAEFSTAKQYVRRPFGHKESRYRTSETAIDDVFPRATWQKLKTTKLVEEVVERFDKPGREVFPSESYTDPLEGPSWKTFFDEFTSDVALISDWIPESVRQPIIDQLVNWRRYETLRFSPTVLKEFVTFLKKKGIPKGKLKNIVRELKDFELPMEYADTIYWEEFTNKVLTKKMQNPKVKGKIVKEVLETFLTQPLPKLEIAIRKKLFEDQAVEIVDLKDLKPVYKAGVEQLKRRFSNNEPMPPQNYVAPDPIVAEYLGIGDVQYKIAPYLNTLLKWKAKAQEMISSKGLFSQVQQIMKGNLTARSIGSGINNFVANVFVQTLQEGQPVALLTRATEINRRYATYKEGKASHADTVMFDAIEKTGMLNTTLVDVEFAALQGRAIPLIELAGIDFINKKSEAFYQFGDNFFKLERAVKVFEILDKYQKMLKEGEWFEIRLDPAHRAKIYTKPTTIERHTTKIYKYTEPHVAHKKFAEAGRESANNILFDYRDLSLWENFIKASPIIGVVSPFLTWTFKALDIPFLKKGLIARLFDDVPYVKTNSRAINLKLAAKDFKRAINIGKYTSYSILEMRQDKDRLRKILSYLDKRSQAMLIEETSNPLYAKTLVLGSLDFTEPTVKIIRLLNWGYTVTFGDSLEDIKEITKEDPSLIWMMDDDGKVLPKYKKIYRETKARRDLFIRRKAGKLGTWADWLGLVGLDGGLLMDVIAKVMEDEAVGGGLNAASFYNSVAPLILSGNIAKLVKAGTGYLEPDSWGYALSMRQWTDVPVDAEQETAIKYAIRMIIGKGWKIKGISKNRKRYFMAFKKALKRGMLGRLKRVRQNFINAGDDDAADNMDDRIDFISELINETVLEMQEEYLDYIDELETKGEER